MDVWRHAAGPLGGHVKLPADKELPGSAEHWWVCAEKRTEAGLWQHQRLRCLPGNLKSREEKTNVEVTDPCVELEVEGTC